mmetsp:Transcript_13278/g.19526  ORF Transcript_13278/g.19526 Transcript_13278/m.19526 type:complete len:1125 (-) Transcript_13278:1010-4384(-)
MSTEEEREEGWEDDDMEELFSFGTEGVGDKTNDPVVVDAPSPTDGSDDSGRERSNSADSFLEMLGDDIDVDTSLSSPVQTSGVIGDLMDKETEDILSWLNEDDDAEASNPTESAPAIPEGQKNCIEKPSTDEASPAPVVADMPEPEPAQPTFMTLQQALNSSDATVEEIRDLYISEGLNDDSLRPELWCRMVSHKTLNEIQESSIADSFIKWKEQADIDSFGDDRSKRIKNECSILAERIAGISREEATRELTLLLLFYYIGNETEDFDPLLPPVACTIVSAGIPTEAASVLLSKIMPNSMPLLALTQKERKAAAKTLHTEFYLLTCYHLPLLVFHLDRHAPGWHWPRSLLTAETKDVELWRDIENQGAIPQSWLISHLAGECHGTFMDPKWLLSLWDLILTSNNNSLRFFLALAVLEKHSNSLLMATGEELTKALNHILEFKEGTTLEGFSIESEEETTSSEADDWVREWCARARALWESTPSSVVRKLRIIEDEAVSNALLERQRLAETKLEAKLEAEAKAHKQAMEAEREKRAEEGRRRVNKARLIAYYKQYNPGKEGNIDMILETYDSRLDVLDAKLRQKYGHGFNPVIKSTTMANTGKLLSTMNQGLSNQRKRLTKALKRDDKTDVEAAKEQHEVTVRVRAKEILPVICWSTESDSLKKASSRPCNSLKYYLLDSRPEETAREQGRFPTALSLSPEALLDPDRMKEQEDFFESLRGAAHIVVMGEGFSAVQHLYGQKMNPSLLQLTEEDNSRVNLCALFFVKRGFPFVSILDGGFCGAHAWLSRYGVKRNLHPSTVLIDYDMDESMFGKLEKAYREQLEFSSASASEKTQIAIQGLFDKSMISLTRNISRFENPPSGFESPELRFRNPFSGKATSSGSQEFNAGVQGVVPKNTDTANSDTTRKSGSVTNQSTRVDGTESAPTDSASNVSIAQKSMDNAQTQGDKRFGNLGAVFSKTLKSNSTHGQKQDGQQVQEGRFSGLGAAFNKTLKANSMHGQKQDGQEVQEGRFSSLGAAFNKTLKSNSTHGQKQEGQQVQENRFSSLGTALNKTLKISQGNDSQQEAPAILKRSPFTKFSFRKSIPNVRSVKEEEGEDETVIDFESTNNSDSLSSDSLQDVKVS